VAAIACSNIGNGAAYQGRSHFDYVFVFRVTLSVNYNFALAF